MHRLLRHNAARASLPTDQQCQRTLEPKPFTSGPRRRLLGAAPRRWRRVIGPLAGPVNTFFEVFLRFLQIVFFTPETVRTNTGLSGVLH